MKDMNLDKDKSTILSDLKDLTKTENDHEHFLLKSELKLFHEKY